MSGEAGPTPSADRLDILDVLRGFALSGVLLVNFAEIPKAAGGADRATHWLIELFVLTSAFVPSDRAQVCSWVRQLWTLAPEPRRTLGSFGVIDAAR